MRVWFTQQRGCRQKTSEPGTVEEGESAGRGEEGTETEVQEWATTVAHNHAESGRVWF